MYCTQWDRINSDFTPTVAKGQLISKCLFVAIVSIASCLPLDINGLLVIHVRPNVGERPDNQDDLSYLFDV